MNRKLKILTWIREGDSEYTINGVKYVVLSRFVPLSIHAPADNSLSDRLKHHLESGFADLTLCSGEDILMEDDTYLAAGEEAYDAARKT